MNGWTINNSLVRQNILQGIKPDVICLRETHLRNNAVIHLEGYVTNSALFHRTETNIYIENIQKTVLPSKSVQDIYTMSVIDKSVDGIIIVKLVHKESKYSILLINCYLPPENSLYDRDAVGFFAHILSFIYQHCDCDLIQMCGDINSKLGKLIDYIPEVDVVPPRIILDDATNRQGSVFCEFLLDAKCCLVNGRITPEHDNYTFIEPRCGSSIFDYFITSLDGVDSCKAFHVFTARQLVDTFCTGQDVPPNHVPDHSLLLLNIFTGITINQTEAQ